MNYSVPNRKLVKTKTTFVVVGVFTISTYLTIFRLQGLVINFNSDISMQIKKVSTEIFCGGVSCAAVCRVIVGVGVSSSWNGLVGSLG